MATMTKTMAVVIAVSRREGQVTFAISERTSCRNLNGLTFAMCAFRFAVSTHKASAIPALGARPAGGPILGNLSRRKSETGRQRAACFLLRATVAVKSRGAGPGPSIHRSAPWRRYAHSAFSNDPLKAGRRLPAEALAKAVGRSGGAATDVENQWVGQR